MINRERLCLSDKSVNSNNWLSRTAQSKYILNEIYHAMKCFGFTNCIKTDSL